MTIECCYLVGNYDITLDRVISINMSSSTETTKLGNCYVIGPTIGNLTMTGYASDRMHTGCHGKAGVSVPWIRKYDCDTDTVYFLFGGAGKSYVAGDVEGLASVTTEIVTYETVSASSASGPAKLYMRQDQTNGYGLTYSGYPKAFETTEVEDNVTFGNSFATDLSVPHLRLYLQNFSVEFVPGEVPVASYSFMFTLVNS